MLSAGPEILNGTELSLRLKKESTVGSEGRHQSAHSRGEVVQEMTRGRARHAVQGPDMRVAEELGRPARVPVVAPARARTAICRCNEVRHDDITGGRAPRERR